MKRLVFLITSILFNLLTLAQEFTLTELEIIGTTSQLASSASRQVLTISAEQLSQLPVNTIGDVLSYLPGIDIRSRGANGTQTDISVKGGTFDQVLILINGVPIQDAQTGHYAMNIPIPLALIERIEVLEGGTGIYSNYALAGAVNIVTRTEHDSHYVALTMEGGMNRMIHPQLAVSWGKNDWSINAGADYLSANGYDAPNPSDKERTALSNSDIRSANIYLQARYRGLDIQAGAQYKDAGLGMGYGFGSQDQFDATRTAFGAVDYTHYWGKWMLDVQASYRANHDHYEWHRGNSLGSNTHTSHNAAFSAKSAYSYSIGKTTLGLEARNEHLRSTNLGNRNRLSINYFAQQDFNWRSLSASMAFTGSWNSFFGHHFNGGVNFGWHYAPKSTLYVNANHTMRLPTFTDLYYNAGNQKGDDNLKAEKAWQISLGTNYTKQWSEQHSLSIMADLYCRLGSDIIDWVYTPSDTKRPYHAKNEQTVNTYGGEISLAYKYNRWLRHVGISYAYTYLDLDIKQSGSRYLDYLSHKLVCRIEHAICFLPNNYGHLGMTESLRFTKREGEAENAAGQTFAYKPVVLIDASLYWEHKYFRLSAECTNILNTHYYELGGILQPEAILTGKLTVKL